MFAARHGQPKCQLTEIAGVPLCQGVPAKPSRGQVAVPRGAPWFMMSNDPPLPDAWEERPTPTPSIVRGAEP